MSDAQDRLANLSPEKRALLEKRLAAARAPAAAAPAAPALDKIAIVSAACRLPGNARSPDEFWNLLLQGRDLITEVPADRWDGAALFDPEATTENRMNTRFGGFLEGIDQFDAGFFGISPVEAAEMDPQQRLLLETAWEALEAAGQDVDRLAGSATGVFIGAHSHSSDYYLLQLAQKGGFAQHATTGSAHSILANRLSYTLDLRGPSVALDTACSSSLVAIHLACQSLRTGESDLAIAGGVNLLLMPASSLAFSKLHLFSLDGRCRTFDAAASGIVRAEGCGLVVLKRLSQAVRDGDPILAVIAGSAVNQDGLSNGITAPNGPSQVAVIQRALAMANVAPERIGYVETHGTGTVQGDPVEVEALGKVIGAKRDAKHRCWLGAVKTNVGHLEAAAGVAGLVKAALALKHRKIPPNLHFENLNPALKFEGTPFEVPTSTVDWSDAQGPRVAGVSSFGFGGTNAHIVLEEHVPAKAEAERDDPSRERFLAVSARSPEALAQRASAYRDRLGGLSPDALDDFVHTANARRTHHPHRIAVVGRDAYALAQELDRRIGERTKAPPASRETVAPVFVFGDGAPWIAQARELYTSEPAFRESIDAIATALQPLAGWDLAESLRDPQHESRLAAREAAPAVLFALQASLAALWSAWGVRAGAIAGEGAGEVAAAHVAGVLGLPEAVSVAWHRGRSSGAALAQALASVKPRAAALPLIASATGTWAGARDFDAQYWARDPKAPSRAAQGVSQLLDAGYRLFVEMGPQSPVAASIRAAAGDREPQLCLTASVEPGRGARARALASLQSLYEAGLAIDWPGRNDSRRRVVPLPAYPWQHQRHWLEAPDVGALAFNLLGREVAAVQAAPAPECWEMQWRDAPLAGAIDVAQVARAAASKAASLPEIGALAAEKDSLATTERRALDHALAALRALGLAAKAGDRVGSSSAAAAGVAPKHARLWQRLLAMLAEAGVLRAEAEGFVLTEQGANLAPAQPAAGVEAAILERCGTALARALRGEADPLSLLFPEGGADSAAVLYAEGASARVYNRIAAECIAQAARERSGQPLRVLEIGAGTGGTTAAVLPMLPAKSRYTFTDLSPLFLQDAQKRLAPGSVEFSFRKLDVEHEPAAQGFATGAFDVVIAANVLHATADLRAALRHARSLLAPGGLLVLVETVARRNWADLTFGLTEGWWRFTDTELRAKEAILAPAQWPAALEAAGFEAPQVVGDALSSASLHAQAVVLARAPAAAARRLEDSAWLVVADRGGVGARLADSIRAQGGGCEIVEAQAATSHDAAQWKARVERLASAHPGQRLGVVHCGALDAPLARELRLEHLDAAVAQATRPALHVAQALLALPESVEARLTLVTRAAQRADAADADFAPVQSLLWGFGRSVALEHARIWGGLVDLDARFDAAASACAILEELCATSGEDQVAVRAASRRVARLASRPTPQPAPLALSAEGAYLVTGGYGGLGPKVARWLADAGARCIVLIGRSGLPDASTWESLPADHAAADAISAIRGLRGRGVEVRTETGDVASLESMRALFARLREAGRPVRGVLHAAAAIRFQSLDSLTPKDLDDALRAKVHGAWVLHELTRETPLDLFVLFSSGTTVFGAKQLAAYATSNQFLGALAHERAARGLPATCVDWGAWSRIRLLGERQYGGIEQLGFRTMDDARAFEILAGLVRDRTPQCMVALLDVAQACQAYQTQGPRPFLEELAREGSASAAAPASKAPAEEAAPKMRDELAALDPRERRSRMAKLVRGEAARVMGLKDADAIDATKGFFDLGLDSLMAVQLRRRLSALLGETLPATLTFKYPTIATLSEHLAQKLGGDAPAKPAAAPAPAAAAPAAPKAALDKVADADIQALLQAELDSLPEDLR